MEGDGTMGRREIGADGYWYDTFFDQAVPDYHDKLEAAAMADSRRLMQCVLAPIRLAHRALCIARGRGRTRSRAERMRAATGTAAARRLL
jgi:hypothetical protein